MKLFLVVLVVIALLVIILYFKSNTNPTVTITNDELNNGWYWGGEKREGTPDDWVLINPETRSAKWVSPKNLTNKP